MRKGKKATGRPALHAVKVTDEAKANPPPEAARPAPDPEVPASAKRRAFTAEFKRRVLAEADACGPGEIGAVLRRHGLYSSHLTTWRRARERGELAGLTPRKRGRKATAKNPLADEVARLERALRRMTARAERAEGLVEVQKKLAALLGEELPPEEELLDAERKGLPIPPPRKKR
jgi:transposase